MDEVNGTPFGRYRLVQLLGRGGMGEVWRAYDTAANNRTVAIKLLPPQLADDSTFVQRFRREADAAAQLNNPHIIPIHNYGEIDGRLYVDMRLIEGRDLQQVLADGPIEPARAVRIIEQVAKALQAAHRIGLVHRDVKPSNILLDEDDFAYLIDFGIARAADQTRMTGTGSIIGSWHYMSPERLRAGQVDARSDIYALACVLYECLTGSTPYPGDNFEQQITAHLTEPPPRPSSTDPNMPVALDPVIATGMAKDPDQRYATTVELADAARDAITTPLPRHAPPPVEPTQPVQPTRHGADAVREASQPTRPAIGQHVVPPGGVSQAPTMVGSPSGPPLLGPPTPGIQPAGQRPPAMQPRPRPSWRRKKVVIPAAVILAMAVVAAVMVATVTPHRNPAESRHGTQTALPSTGYGPQTAPPSTRYGPQIALFTGLSRFNGVAVDAAGGVYVNEPDNGRVVKLAAGSSTQDVLPFTGLSRAFGVAVDAAGTVYVTDNHNRVVKLAAGSSTQDVLPFTGLSYAFGVAVDAAGNVFVADSGANGRVVKLAAGSSAQDVLPFTGLNNPTGVAVDPAGNVYVTDAHNGQVLKLAAGSSAQDVLPFTGLNNPDGVAVDAAGTVYVADYYNNRVVKLAAGSSAQDVLPFTGLSGPEGVAVDAAGSVYMIDLVGSGGRVVKLPVR
jgi:serine/threonine-protein kinase